MYAGQTKDDMSLEVSAMIKEAAKKMISKQGGASHSTRCKTSSSVVAKIAGVKHKPKSQKRTLSGELRNSSGGKALVEFFSLPEEDPEYFILRASQCFVIYEEFCADMGVEPLTQRAFSMMAQEFVRSFKKGGFHWYEVPHIELEQDTEHAKAA